jgi:hypothetical protein
LPHPDAQLLLIVAILGLAWAAISIVVLAVCRSAAMADAEAAAGYVRTGGRTHLRLISEALPCEDVANGTQENLHIAPKRPVGNVQVVDRSHLA